MIDFGIVKPGTKLYIPFNTYDSNDPSASVTITGLATTDIEIYKDDSVVQRASDAGYALIDTDGIDIDGTTGIHEFSVDLANNTTAGFFAAGSRYKVVVASITVDAGTVNFIAAVFTIGYPDAVLNTSIATLASQTSFTLSEGPAEDDALNGMWCVIHDVASAVQLGQAIISDYVGSTKTVTLAAGTTFTAAATDNVAVMGPSPLQPSIAGNTLAVTNGGAGGVDWGHVENKATSNDLSATSINLCDTVTDITNGVDLSASAVDDVWDEVLTGATHNVPSSSGRRLRGISGTIFTDGTAQSGGNNTIQLAAGDVTIDDQYQRARVIITGGTGTGQEGIITSSVAATDTLTIAIAWHTNPDATSEYNVIPGQVHTTVRNGGYDNGFVYIDTINGNPGTQKGVNGTSTNPSDNLTDTYVIMAQESISSVMVRPGSALVLPSDTTGKLFSGAAYTVALNGQEIGATRFESSTSITGIGLNTASALPVFNRCAIGNCTLPPISGESNGFFGTITIGAEGNFTIANSAAIFNSSLTIDYGVANNASNFFLINWRGGSVEIQNAGAGTGSYGFDMVGVGDLTVNANCSATTTVTLGGAISRNADVAGITYSELENILAVLGIPVGDDLSADIAALPTDLENADALLNRDMSAVSDTNSRSPLNALRHIRNKWSIAVGVLTVTKEDDSTTAWTSAVVGDAAADPIVSSDPV